MIAARKAKPTSQRLRFRRRFSDVSIKLGSSGRIHVGQKMTALGSNGYRKGCLLVATENRFEESLLS